MKLKLIYRDPRVSILVTEELPPFRSIEVRAEAQFITHEDKEQHFSAIRMIHARYFGEEGVDALLKKMPSADSFVIVRIEPGELNIHDHSGSPMAAEPAFKERLREQLVASVSTRRLPFDIVMSQEQREGFLAGVRCGIVSVTAKNRGPVSTPVWYKYKPGGDVVFFSEKPALKSKLLQKYGRMTLVVQDEDIPYKYVSVEGTVTLTDTGIEDDVREVVEHYLGEEGAEKYLKMAPHPDSDTFLVKMKPERWNTGNFDAFFDGFGFDESMDMRAKSSRPE